MSLGTKRDELLKEVNSRILKNTYDYLINIGIKEGVSLEVSAAKLAADLNYTEEARVYFASIATKVRY
jgi:hypothetical protein